MNILFQWKPEYNLNIKEIDQQHKKLIDMINVLYDAIATNQSGSVIGTSINDLIEYGMVHFKEEEKLFIQHGFPEAEAHTEAHRWFMKQAKQYATDYAHNMKGLPQEVVTFLSDWLQNHIIQMDPKYAKFIMGKKTD